MKLISTKVITQPAYIICKIEIRFLIIKHFKLSLFNQEPIFQQLLYFLILAKAKCILIFFIWAKAHDYYAILSTG